VGHPAHLAGQDHLVRSVPGARCHRDMNASREHAFRRGARNDGHVRISTFRSSAGTALTATCRQEDVAVSARGGGAPASSDLARVEAMTHPRHSPGEKTVTDFLGLLSAAG
jgi:hypothetical protein